MILNKKLIENSTALNNEVVSHSGANKMEQGEIIIFNCNVNGSKSYYKTKLLCRTIRQHLKANICILTETHINNKKNIQYFVNSWGSGQESCFFTLTEEATKGIAIMFGKETELVTHKVEKDREGRWLIWSGDIKDHKNIAIIGMYLSTNKKERLKNIREIKQKLDIYEQNNYKILAGGDMNFCDKKQDRVHINHINNERTYIGKKDWEEALEWKKITNKHNMKESFADIHGVKSATYTWKSGIRKDKTSTHSFLDRIYIPEDWQCSHAKKACLPLSDHNGICIKIRSNSYKKYPSVHWKYPTSIPNEEKLKALIEIEVNNIKNEHDKIKTEPDVRLLHIFSAIRETTKKHMKAENLANKTKNKHSIRNKIKRYIKNHVMDEEWDKNIPIEEYKEVIRLLELDTNMAIKKLRSDWLKLENMSKGYFSLGKPRIITNNITKVTYKGVTKTGEGILENLTEFYKDIYDKEDTISKEEITRLLEEIKNKIKKIDNIQKEKLEKEINAEAEEIIHKHAISGPQIDQPRQKISANCRESCLY